MVLKEHISKVWLKRNKGVVGASGLPPKGFAKLRKAILEAITKWGALVNSRDITDVNLGVRGVKKISSNQLDSTAAAI